MLNVTIEKVSRSIEELEQENEWFRQRLSEKQNVSKEGEDKAFWFGWFSCLITHIIVIGFFYGLIKLGAFGPI